MPHDRPIPTSALRRQLLCAPVALLALPGLVNASEGLVTDVNPGPNAELAALLRTGGVVLALRHALAPGTFDPPQFRLGDCSTQRNLNAEGQAQARRIGAWFRSHRLQPAVVRSSPWCRCQDTATLAFGTSQTWAALGSPRGSAETVTRTQVRDLRAALAAVPAGRFEVWVTHMFVISDLAATGVGSGEGLVLRAPPSAGAPATVLARLAVA